MILAVSWWALILWSLSLISIALSSFSETGSYHLMFVAEMRLFLLEQQIGGFWQALNSRGYGNIWDALGFGGASEGGGVWGSCVCVRAEGRWGCLGGADVLMVPNEGANNEASPCGLHTHTNTYTNTCTNKDKRSKDQRPQGHMWAFWSTDVLGLDEMFLLHSLPVWTMGILMKPVLLKYEHVSLRAAPDMHVQLLGCNFLLSFTWI